MRKLILPKHLVAPFTRFVDEPTFLGYGFNEADTFVVEGEGELFNVINVMSEEFENILDTDFRVLPSIGNLGMTKSGQVIADLDKEAFGDATLIEAFAAAATALAFSPEALKRRVVASGELKWLESLYRLPDLRPGQRAFGTT